MILAKDFKKMTLLFSILKNVVSFGILSPWNGQNVVTSKLQMPMLAGFFQVHLFPPSDQKHVC